jgi:hypothetical protein
MIIICDNWKEYESVQKDLHNLSGEISVLAVRNEDAFMYYSPGDNEAKKTCTFDLLKSKVGIAHWFCTLDTLLQTVNNYFKNEEEPTVEISMEDIAKAFDIPSKCIKIVD